ncbi:sigma-54-dependent transcriptional regulator [Vibrio hippocampi]|uniref:Regulatory protein LuxO n=1 Tax=Vibrio hippocampi TaxID=654686 RepID=A0ABM8ZNA9_9VIBR|nr:sigma-54 dependent transcriptional regulator [Vibrio hippocampi]CAH0529962.1 Regulatory protein LuxO [Vibrio hippocampi]
MAVTILLIEDSNSLAVLYKQFLKDEPYNIIHAETGAEAIRTLERTTPALVILDLQLPDMQGDEILSWMENKSLDIPVIVATAHGSVDIAVNMIQKGAKDFLEKPIRSSRLKTSVAIHLKQAKLETMLTNIKEKLDRDRFHDFIGASIPMQNIYKVIDSVASTTASVFIVGESGTGKEVCANAIHKESNRHDKPFIAINCGAIPKDLMESEIFGHTKGAFTGATLDRKGAASMADGGTLFLDELCEMELEMQKKLLRFLQTGTFSPLGSSKEHKVDVRIICATNRDPLQEVEQGRFREDLYYRVHVVPLNMPPLRDRDEDIITLAQHFLRLYAKQDNRKFESISQDAQRFLKRYRWPGNVRQLQNVIRSIVVLNDEKSLGVQHLPNEIKVKTSPAKSSGPTHSIELETPQLSIETSAYVTANTAAPMPTNSAQPIRPMWQIERDAIQQAIDHCDGNVLNAAMLLELSPSTIYRKKQAWEAEENAFE